MQAIVLPLAALFGGLGILLIGNGLLATVLSVRSIFEGYSVETTGLIMAGYFVGFIIGSFQCIRLIERAGHIRTFAALASLASAASLAFPLLVHPVAWGVLRGVLGFCFAGLYMVIESWLNERATNTDRGRVLSVYQIVSLSALAAGQFLLTAADPKGYTLFCLSSILVSLGLVPVALTRAIAPTPHRVAAMSPLRLFRVSPLGLAGCLAAGLALGAFWSLGPVFGQKQGWDESRIAFFMAVTITGGMVLQWPIGWLSDRLDRRQVILGVCAVAAAVSLALSWANIFDRILILPLACLFGGFSFPIYSLSVAHTNDHLSSGNLVEASSGLLMAYGIGAIAGPVLGGLSMGQAGPMGLFAFIACIMALNALFALYRMTRRAPLPLDQQEPAVVVPRTTPVAYELHPRAESDPPLEQSATETAADVKST